MYIKRYRRQLLEKCCGCEKKKQEQSSDIYHEDCQECVQSFCGEWAQYPSCTVNGGGKILIDLYIALNFFVYCDKMHVLFSYHKLSLL